jgi:hypothetical protein
MVKSWRRSSQSGPKHEICSGVWLLICSGECQFQPPARFTVDLDRGDLFSDQSGPGVEERQIQIRPQRSPLK